MITLAEIQAKCDAATLATHDYAAIAAAVNVGRTKVETKLGGIGLVLETLGPVDGAALLDGLETQSVSIPALKWAWVLINRGELDFGSSATRAMVSQLVPSPAKEALLAVAEVPDPVSLYDLTVALQDSNGVWRV